MHVHVHDQEPIEPQSGEGACNWEIAKFKHGRWELKLVAALYGYSGTYLRVH